MPTPMANIALVPRFVNAVGSQLSLESCACAVSAIEAGFYGILKGGVHTSQKVVNWIRETSIAHIQTIQILFNLTSAGIVVLLTKQLVEAIQEKFAFTVIDKSAGFWSIQSVPILLAIGAITAAGVMLINRFLPPDKPKKTVGQVDISESINFQQKVGKVLHAAKIIIGLALACFSKNRLWLLLSISATAYSLSENMQLKWMTFSRSFPFTSFNPQVPVTLLKADYNVLVLPPAASAIKENCVICQDDSVPVNMAFCAHHMFHQECVAGLAQSKSDSFLNNLKITKHTEDHYQHGIYIRTSHRYTVSVSQNNFPSCPTCRDIPLQNDCQIEVTDQRHGKFNASVTIERPPVDRQHLFENCYAIYNVAQAALTYLQTYPELAGTIFKIQKMMLPIDFAAYALTVYYLYQKVNAKFNPQDSTAFKVATVALLVAAAVLSYVAVMQLNAYLRSTMVIKDVLAQLNLSPELLNSITVGWNSPLAHQLMQTLYLNRIASIFALSFFSEQRKTNLLSAAAQLGSFMGISNLKWIKLTQALEWPLQQIVSSGGTLLGSLHKKSLKSLSVTSYFLVPPSCSAQAAQLKTTLQSITTFASSFFNKSKWDHYWQVTHTQGIETGRWLYYRVFLQNAPLDTSTATLTDCSINAIDATYGATKTVIKHAI